MKRRIQGLTMAVAKTEPSDGVPLSLSACRMYSFPVFFFNMATRFRKMTGAYVSGTKSVPTIHKTPENMVRRPITQRQPSDSLRNPAIHGDVQGPKEGAKANKLIARPRSDAGKISAMTPPALVIGEEPKAPAKNRKTSSVPVFFEPAQPALKAVKAPKLTVKMI